MKFFIEKTLLKVKGFYLSLIKGHYKEFTNKWLIFSPNYHTQFIIGPSCRRQVI